ncbi:DUF397 domain-containing protein [Actinoplanes sp. NPDC026619]|uniref:DUF397 domain-containing protein n=1 Tax=Actinoplanes sp. NPDC026619 TaxID=3155798 RepID=UPI00340788F4
MSEVSRSGPAWRRSARCASETCVEVMFDAEGDVLLRSSRRPEAVLRMTTGQWAGFLSNVARGDLA